MNYSECKKKLIQYMMARIPFISIDSIEINRILNMLYEIANETNLDIIVNSMSKGSYSIKNNEIVDEGKATISVLDYIAKEIKLKENMTFVLTDISDIESDNVTSRYLYDIVTMAEERNASIIVVKDSNIWSNLRRMGMNLVLDFPDNGELYKLITDTLGHYRDRVSIEWNKEDFMEASNVLLGISEMEVKNILMSLIAKGTITKEDLMELKYTKDSMFDDISGLSKIDVEQDMTFGGLENLRNWLDEKQKLMLPSKREKMIEHHIKPPRGVLVVGVPGCGKSLCAKAISSMWHLPLYLLDFATVQGMYVGQSEQQLREALDTAEQVSPCVLWIDEIEKGLSSKSSNGTTDKMIGQFLFWLQECKKEVFVVATANDITSLPAELFRKGRFDEIFFVDLPTKGERIDIIKLYLKKYLNININEDLMNKLVELSVGFSGSDIESCIRDIAYHIVAKEEQLTQEFIVDTFANTLSVSKTNPEKIDNIRKWGNEHATSASKRETI